jgi:hypothetical protein
MVISPYRHPAYMFMGVTLFVFFSVPCSGKFLVEFVNPACRVNEFHFPREKRVRLAGNLQLNERVFIAVLPHNSVIGRSAGTCQKGLVTREVLKYHGSVFLWMRIFLHNNSVWKGRKSNK